MTPAPSGEATFLASRDDRELIARTLYAYAAGCDTFDREAIRATVADDVWAQYGNGEPIIGGDALADWISGMTSAITWQQHTLTVYTIDVDGDHADALTYLHSYQGFADDPDTALVMAGRYHDEFRRTDVGWRISRRTMDYLWATESSISSTFMPLLGGLGPGVWSRDR
ncbi:nuclear transport factor 2 family protein [Gordonia sp. OPL2]|uniref:nuclear transport factor 2 family protein n=1 Tax=Gordonia sp. OPL2 TaxID=2486274 RepID=UPI00165515C4|nr:nuclear transport factor 2 family protein [Gordonia sp. OPL2]ROZ99082.1 nuclear transport factor 2 family protein [Gordonia sp. OPL2]